MKKLFLIMALTAVFMLLGATAASAETMLLEYDGGVHEYNGEVYSLIVNNKEIDPPLSPIIFNDRALVPVREIFEEVGATVEYDGEDQSVTIYNEDTTIVMFINNNVAYINGQKTLIPDNVVPKLISKLGGETKTMVPVRFISESIGMPVDFDAENGAILVASDKDYYTVVEVEKTDVTGVEYRDIGENEIAIDIDTSAAVEHIADFEMSDPGRLVIDLNSAALACGTDTINVNKYGITTIRLGDNGSRVRIVVDSEYVESYTVDTVSDNRVCVTVKTNYASYADDTSVSADTVTDDTSVSQETAAAETVAADASVISPHVILDAGHGGTDSGAVGTLNGETILEKDLTLSITYKVKEILESNGVTVTMTRTGDTLPSLVERPTQANNENAALFVSIHINSAEATSASGIETYYSTENNGDSYGVSSAELAEYLLEGMLGETGAVNRGVKTANHAVTRRCNMPASLVECGFISNDEEIAKMCTDEYQQKLAQGIASGILKAYSQINF
ncbi:MAG: N-acetylmuramoyl-L-alanine amidase family protein [Firmicutes bacterium]|nr:N-acetylmuramoyl-L-alanine amidase family protein [Bacillota bacterium]